MRGLAASEPTAPSISTPVESKFTPGPWELRGLPGDGEWAHLGVDAVHTGFSIIIVGYEHEETGIHGRDREEAIANARLIAAAPDLLYALQAIVSDVLEYERSNNLAPNPGREYCWASVALAKIVIAKATHLEQRTSTDGSSGSAQRE